MTTKEFIQYAGECPELCEKLSACTTPEDAFSIAKDEGLTDDKETFIAVMETAHTECDQISNEDLVNIQAAGTRTAALTATAGVSVVTAVVAASTAGV